MQRPGLSAVAGAIAFRWVCFALMICLAVWNESRPGTKLFDPILAAIPHVPWVERWNYWIWIASWAPALLWLGVVDRSRFVRLLIAGGIVSLLRGACILLGPLGPVRGPDVNVDLDWTLALRARVVGQILNPFAVFGEQSAHIWLTKDLFFSGHVASTFLLLLYVWPHPRMRWIALTTHVLVVASVFLGGVHYTVDVLGAYVIVWGVFVWRERGTVAGEDQLSM